VRPCSSTREYYERAIGKLWPVGNRSQEEEGLAQFLVYILESKAFHASTESGEDGEPESFVLAHADFNLQNILVDPKTGEVAGIIDWEGAHIVPRCVGFTSVPLSLRCDWVDTYAFLPDGPGTYQEWSVQKYEQYRKSYARAMKYSMGCTSDSFFTEKSAAYNAFHTTLFPEVHYYNGKLRDLVKKVLWQAMPYADARFVVRKLTEGDDNFKSVVRKGVLNFFAPC
jgi:hypothetical protein